MATTVCHIHFQHEPLCTAIRRRATQYGSCSSCLRWDPLRLFPWTLCHGVLLVQRGTLCFVWCATVGSKGESLGLSFHRSSCSMPYLIDAVSVLHGAVRGVPLCTSTTDLECWKGGCIPDVCVVPVRSHRYPHAVMWH